MARVQTNFTAGSFGTGKASAPKAAQPAEKKADTGSDEVPEGTTEEVYDWVDDDPAKARRALAAEKKSDSPRVTLTSRLERVLNSDAKKSKKDE